MNPEYSNLDRSIYNISSIQNIILEKATEHSLSSKLDKVTKLVTLSAAAVLKNIDAYMTGEKLLSEKQCKQISRQFEKIRIKLQKAAYNEEVKLQGKMALMDSMLDALRSRNVDRNDVHAMENLMEDYYQVMGCIVSYGKWKEGDQILGPYPGAPHYRVNEVIKNKKGLQIVVLVPDPQPPDKSIPPILCCRGTTSNPHNLIDDMNDHIGQYSLEASKEQIRSTLTRLSEKYGPAVLSGHSLGGAIAQGIAAEFCDQNTHTGTPLIKAAYHFNAPGVGSAIARDYKARIQKMPEEKRPKIYAFHHSGDIVSLAGGRHLKATKTKEIGDQNSSIKQIFSPLTTMTAAHCWKKFMSEFTHIRVVNKSRVRKYTKVFSEGIRNLISNLFRQIIFSKILMMQVQKETARKVADLLEAHKVSPI